MSTLAARVGLLPHERTATQSIPWYVWAYFLATVSSMIGGIWDISWHKSIGRDTFWTPAHILIYLCGVTAGLTAAWQILSTTLQAASPARPTSVAMWGFRGPLAAFIAAWGGTAMLVSGPFDNWWHNAYGLDVKILSPPHVLLIFGLLAIRLAALILILGEMNRAEGAAKRSLDRLFLFVATLWLGGSLGMFLELTTRNYMHSARFYLIIGILGPLFLMAAARASADRWAATKIGATFTVVACAFLWILPLFPAEPLLGPVYHKVTHFIPNDFPLLVLFPAIALDLLRRPAGAWPRWRHALVAGPVFVAVFLAVQWPFAEFLISPASRNWLFGTHYIPFFVPPDSDYVRGAFTVVEQTAAEFWIKMALALAVSVAAARAGLAWGDWMRHLRR